jgi:hypothetical protein
MGRCQPRPRAPYGADPYLPITREGTYRPSLAQPQPGKQGPLVQICSIADAHVGASIASRASVVPPRDQLAIRIDSDGLFVKCLIGP